MLKPRRGDTTGVCAAPSGLRSRSLTNPALTGWATPPPHSGERSACKAHFDVRSTPSGNLLHPRPLAERIGRHVVRDEALHFIRGVSVEETAVSVGPCQWPWMSPRSPRRRLISSYSSFRTSDF